MNSRKDEGPLVAIGFEGTDRDAATLRTARRIALRRMRAIDEARRLLKLDAFRTELGATIRCVTPLLLPLLELTGMNLDEAVWTIEPPSSWPRHPRVGTFLAGQRCGCRSPRRPFDFATGVMTRCPFCAHDRGALFSIANERWFRMDVFRHSLEVTGRLGSLQFATELGRLNIQIDVDLPVAVRTACVGRVVGEVIDHDILRGRDWKIIATADSPSNANQVILMTETDFVTYLMPWAR